jgi:hypothetical protein
MNVETQSQGAADTVPAGQSEDVFLIQEGILKMTIGTKPQGPWPIHCLPSSTGAELTGIAASGAAVNNIMTSTADLKGPMYSLFPNLVIANLQQFTAQMVWAAALTLSVSTKSVWLMFDGQLARPVQ